MLDQRYGKRLAKCRVDEAAGLDVLLLTKPANMFYLTGDGRLCAYAMITQDGKVALGVPTDVEDVKRPGPLRPHRRLRGRGGHDPLHRPLLRALRHPRRARVGLEYTFLTAVHDGHAHPPPRQAGGRRVKDCTHILSELRMVKEPDEIERIRAQRKVADDRHAAAVEAVKPGVTESQVAAAAEYAMRHAGAEEFWRSYVCSGPRTNIAHGLPTKRKLADGDLVMIDMHPIVDGYSADICRTVCVGQPTAEQQAAYDLYLKAQQATIGKIRAGVGMVELEGTMHGVLKEAGHGEHIFGPPIHGVGIEFEEAPLPRRPRLLPRREGPAAAGQPTSSSRWATAGCTPARGASAWRTPTWSCLMGARR